MGSNEEKLGLQSFVEDSRVLKLLKCWVFLEMNLGAQAVSQGNLPGLSGSPLARCAAVGKCLHLSSVKRGDRITYPRAVESIKQNDAYLVSIEAPDTK